MTDYIFYLALLNCFARQKKLEAQKYKKKSPQYFKCLSKAGELYDIKAITLAKLAYLGELKQARDNPRSAESHALLIGYSPVLGYHGFHIPTPPHYWAQNLPMTTELSAKRSGQRLELAAKDSIALEEVMKILGQIPELPTQTAKDWGFLAI